MLSKVLDLEQFVNSETIKLPPISENSLFEGVFFSMYIYAQFELFLCFVLVSLLDLFSKRRRRIKANEGNWYNASAFPSSWRFKSEEERNHTTSGVVDHSDPLSTNDLLKEIDSGKFGSVSKEIEELLKWRMDFLDSFFMKNPELQSAFLDVQNKVELELSEIATPGVIDLDDDQDGESDAAKRFVPETQLPHHSGLVVIIDSDDDNDAGSENHKSPFLEVELKQPYLEVELKPPPVNLLTQDKPSGSFLMKDFLVMNICNYLYLEPYQLISSLIVYLNLLHVPLRNLFHEE